MQTNIKIDQFIASYITKRAKSLLADDFAKYNAELNDRINGKKVLVIGDQMVLKLNKKGFDDNYLISVVKKFYGKERQNIRCGSLGVGRFCDYGSPFGKDHELQAGI